MEITPYAEEPFCQINTSGTLVFTDFNEFLKDPSLPLRILIEVNALEISGELSDPFEIETYAEQPYCVMTGERLLGGAKKFTFSDGIWISKPNDPTRPNSFAHARLSGSAGIERNLPLAPEGERRSSLVFSDINVSNIDGEFDELINKYSISGRVVRIYLGRPEWAFGQFQQIGEAFGLYTEATEKSIKIRVQTSAFTLEVPLQSYTYSGTGGLAGDAGLFERKKPICYGRCFNITPVLVNRDQWVYQVHDGRIFRVDQVKDLGLPLTPTGIDSPSYSALRALQVPNGYWATCKALGLIKVGLSGSGPQGIITADVDGDVSFGYYSDKVGDLLLRSAVNRAKISVNLLDLQSFYDLDTGPVGYYYDGVSNVTVKELFNDLLRGVNAFYGPKRSRVLTVGKLLVPENKTPRYEFVEEELFKLEQLPPNYPLYSQNVYYGKNFTPMTTDQLSQALDSDTYTQLQLPAKIYRAYNAESKVRNINSVEGEIFDSYLVNQAEAQELCRDLLDIYGVNRRLLRVVIGRIGYSIDTNDVIKITSRRFGLSGGRNFLVTGIKEDSIKGQVELELWG